MGRSRIIPVPRQYPWDIVEVENNVVKEIFIPGVLPYFPLKPLNVYSVAYLTRAGDGAGAQVEAVG